MDTSVIKRTRATLATMYADYHDAITSDDSQLAITIAASIKETQFALHQYRAGVPMEKFLDAIAIVYGG
jgi:hypothetical protein